MLFEQAGISSDLPFILPPVSTPFAEDANQIMGLWNNGSLQWDDGCWQLDGIYLASTYKQFCSWTPDSASWMRQKMCPDIESKSRGKKLFYISRKNALRPVEQEDKLLEALKSWNLTVIEPDRLPMREQIKLFSEAGLVMGPQGAGIQNVLWAPRGCPILELISPRFFSGVYWTLAESLGNRYGLVAGDTPFNKHPMNVGTSFNPKLVNRALEVLLEN